MSLSLAMIVKNESVHLPHCLASVRNLVDQMIVVDTGSTDGTPELAQQEGALVCHVPWTGDFSAARNESLRRCTCDWILVLDADEAVDALDHASIQDTLKATSHEAFELRLRNYCEDGNYGIRDDLAVPNHSSYLEGREHPFYVDAWGLRLFRNLPGVCFTGSIHELVYPFFAARGSRVQRHQAVIHHFGKLDREAEARKAQSYFQICLRTLESQPKDPQALFNVVQQALQAHDWPAAVEHAERFRALDQTASPLILFAGGFALLQQGQALAALPWFEDLLRLQPGHVQGLLHLSTCLHALGRVEEARKALHKVIAARPTLSQAYLNLAELERRLGRVQEGRATLQRGFQICAQDRLFLHGAVLFDLCTQDVEAAMTHAAGALHLYPDGGDGVWHQLVALRLWSQGNAEEALAVLDQGLQRWPGNTDLQRLRHKWFSSKVQTEP